MKVSSRINILSKHDPCVRKAAEFAVEDHNQKNSCMSVTLAGVEKAAREFVFGTIYYLIIKVNPTHPLMKNDLHHFETAVWVIPELKFRESVGLASFSDKPQQLQPGLCDPQVKGVVNVALEHHNRKERSKLKLVSVVACSRLSSKYYVKHIPTFLARDQAKSISLLCQMVVTEHNGDNFMESYRLNDLCDYPFPDWISLLLLKKVRRLFVHKHRILICKNEDSIPIPLFKNVDSIRRLSAIAADLGVERTRTELIPFLSVKNDHVDDAVLRAMAEELKAFIPHVGGMEYADVLLPPLGTLCTIEDPFVRDKAVESLCSIGGQMKESNLLHHFIPLVKRLATGGCFADRVSSCGLFHIAYPSAPKSMKAELRMLYSQLCHDDMTAVRRSAAFNLGKFATTVEPSHLKTDIIPIFKDLTEDEKDSVRLLSVECFTTLAKLLEPQDRVSHIYPAIVKLSQDKFWHVRYMVANNFYEPCLVWEPEHTRVDVVLAYVHLLRDIDAQVRVAATGNVTKLCTTLNSKLAIHHVLPCVKELPSDSHKDVRSTLASVIMGMAPVLGKDAAIEQLLPIILDLLNDEYHNVRMNIIKKLDEADQVFDGIDQFSQSLLAATVELAHDKDWTVRREMREQIPVLARHLGVVDTLKFLYSQKLGEEKGCQATSPPKL